MSTWAIALYTFSQCQICLKWCSLGWNISRHHKLSNEHLFIIVIAHVVATYPVECRITWSPYLDIDMGPRFRHVFAVSNMFQMMFFRLKYMYTSYAIEWASFFHSHSSCSRYVTRWMSNYMVTFLDVDMRTRFRHVFEVSNMFQMMFFRLKHM